MKTKIKFRSGFTLIEILVVVALMGALFIGILASIDPLEQLKKGTDTSRRNSTAEIYNGMVRYYSVKGSFPWAADLTSAVASAGNMTDTGTGYITQTLSAGELKPEFITLAKSNLAKIYLTSTADALGNRQNLAVCFLPDSKSFRLDLNSKYGINGAYSSGCLSETANGTACYWCVK